MTASTGRSPDHRDAGTECAVRRGYALQPDPAAQAARRLRSSRVQVIDLTPYFCGRELCYPVIGGALVYRDSNHLTAVFATTLGPILTRYVDRLMRAWR